MTQGVKREKEEIEALKRKIIEEMIVGFGRTLSVACQEAAVSVPEVYTWRKEDAEFDLAIEQAREVSKNNRLDLAETNMTNIIKDANHKEHGKTLRWYLDRHGRPRGYVSSTQVAVVPPNRPTELTDDMSQAEVMAALGDALRANEA